MSYITAKQIQDNAQSPEAEDLQIFKDLANAASELFDLVCEVPKGYFEKAVNAEKEFYSDGTIYLNLPPYLKESISEVAIDNMITTDYIEKDGYLIFDNEIVENTKINVTADFGFEKVPADVIYACLEMALLMWRRKDLNFATISELDNTALLRELPPTALVTCQQYKLQCSQFVLFG